MSSGLAECLVRDGVLSAEIVRSAAGRQMVYGGGLDTALLEMAVVDESTVWGTLAASSGLPVPPAALMDEVDPTVAATLGPRPAADGLAVPVARHGDRVAVLCADPAEAESLRRRAGTHGLDVDLYIAPEVRVHVAAQMVFGTPMPPRFLRLLAHLVGAQVARRWMLAQTPAPLPLPRAPTVVTVTRGPPTVEAPAAAPEPPAASKRHPPRSTEGTPRPTRGKRAAAAAALALPDDPAAAVEGLAPLQQVMEQAQAIQDSPGGSEDDYGEFSLSAENAAPRPGTLVGPSAPSPIEPPPAPPRRRTGRVAVVTVDANAPPDEETLQAAETGTGESQTVAFRALRTHLGHPRVAALTARLRDDVVNAPGGNAIPAVTALGELRDPAGIPALLGRLGEHDAALTKSVHAALVEIAKQDFGYGVRRWRVWWNGHQDDERIEWLFGGLSHKTSEIRFSAAEDLRQLTGEYFGYHFDLPKREREEARARWESWWLENRGKNRSAPAMPAAADTHPGRPGDPPKP
jgi:hypothetical protein